MDSYYTLLKLSQTFALNEKELESAYFAAQKLTHPDRFIGKPETDRIEAIRLSTLVNDAYEALKSPLHRAEHLLLLHGYSALDEDAAPPAELLMEIMDLREQLAEASGKGSALAQQINEIKSLHASNLKTLETAFAEGDYPLAARETMRLQYLGKAMEEAHMLMYRLKAVHA